MNIPEPKARSNMPIQCGFMAIGNITAQANAPTAQSQWRRRNRRSVRSESALATVSTAAMMDSMDTNAQPARNMGASQRPPGIAANSTGRVSNSRPGPAAKSRPKASTAGTTNRAASSAAPRSVRQVATAVGTIRASRRK